MSQQQPELDLTPRSLYRSWVSHTIRYNDLDPLGHVNNAVYSTFLEAGARHSCNRCSTSTARAGSMS